MPIPSSVLVPLPSSSINMSDLSLALCRIYAIWKYNFSIIHCDQTAVTIIGKNEEKSSLIISSFEI